MAIANVDMAAAWDGEEGARWAEHAEQYEATAQPYRERLLAAAAITEESVVLDIGCGTGRSTRDAARIARAGSALGVDLSSRMLERARAAAEAEGLTNVRFEQADAQVHPFAAGGFDVAISSFGAMFFADPVAAFANIAQALGQDGRLAIVAWRELSRNEWIVTIREALAAGRQLPEPPPDAPGPFAFARREYTEQVLRDAGFVDIAFEDVTDPIRVGADTEDAFSFATTMGIARGLTEDLDEASTTTAFETLRRAIAERETDAGVVFGASAWLITARPG